MKVSEMILLGFFLVFSGVLLFYSLDMPYFSGQGFGAGFIPLNMSVAVIFFAALIGVRSLWVHKKIHTDTRKPLETKQISPGSERKQSVVPPIVTIVLLLFATLLMGFGSILLPLAVLMAFISAFFLGNTWLASIRMTIITLAVIYLIFSVWLKIPIN